MRFGSLETAAFTLLALFVGFSCTAGHGGSGDGGVPPVDRRDLTPAQTGGCRGLECFQMDCGNQPPTSISGRVTAPNGIDPVYDALVYVPITMTEFPTTIQCETCNEPIGGTPLVQTRTAVDGTFKLLNIPVSAQVPIVIQKGRFRRTVLFDPQGCTDNALDADRARLPRNKQEGNLPKMAVAQGDFDQIECVLHSMGIDAAEFTQPLDGGSVHLFDNGGTLSSDGTNFTTLLDSPSRMSNYNLIFINCTNNIFANVPNRDRVLHNLFDYVNSGGRLYVTDLAYDYLEQVPQFAPYIYFEGGGSMILPQPQQAAAIGSRTTDIKATVTDPTLIQWLSAAKVSQNGQITVTDLLPGFVLMHSPSLDQMRFPSTTWIHGDTNGMDRPLTVAFDYNNCGKILFSSYHTREPGGAGVFNNNKFPSYCKSTANTMIAQEKILEYLILQISACVGPIG